MDVAERVGVERLPEEGCREGRGDGQVEGRSGPSSAVTAGSASSGLPQEAQNLPLSCVSAPQLAHLAIRIFSLCRSSACRLLASAGTGLKTPEFH